MSTSRMVLFVKRRSTFLLAGLSFSSKVVKFNCSLVGLWIGLLHKVVLVRKVYHKGIKTLHLYFNVSKVILMYS